MTGSALVIFLLGALIGVLFGGALCVRYLRHEIAADICPRLRRLQLQLENLESAINLSAGDPLRGTRQPAAARPRQPAPQPER